MHLRHPPRGVPRYPGPDYDTLPCRFISKPAGRLPKRATETTSGWETGFRGLIRLNVAPYNFTERGTNFPEQRPITPGRLDKREISLGQFGTIRNSFYRKSKVPSPLLLLAPYPTDRLRSVDPFDVESPVLRRKEKSSWRNETRRKILSWKKGENWI